jgi:deoxyribose-phosphate aldolase
LISDTGLASHGERSTEFSREDVATRMQSTLIQTGVTREEIIRHCADCRLFGFNAAMVPARFVRVAVEQLEGSSVIVASAVDFPYGLMSTVGKQAEACAVVAMGAAEVDIGIPIGLVKDGAYGELEADISGVVRAIEPVPIKVMLELPLLTAEERDRVVDLTVSAGAAFVKNASSGAVGAATPEDMRYLRQRAPAHVGVKASGGIKTWDHVVSLLEAGADLVGTSAAVAIIERRPQRGANGY